MRQYWMECVERKKKIPLFFHIDILKFHDFSMILAFFPNSMIFPGLENAFFIFQVFHDFPGRWEPCLELFVPQKWFTYQNLQNYMTNLASIKIRFRIDNWIASTV